MSFFDPVRKLRPFLDGISGVFTDSSGKTVCSFKKVCEIIGGEPDPKTGENPRDKLKRLNPGTLIIELPGGTADHGVVDVTLTVPDDCPCPQGTTEKK